MTRLTLACLILASAFAGSAASAHADALYDRCIDESDGTNAAWAVCGSAWVTRADAALNATWKRVYADTEGQTKTDLLAGQRAWIAFKDKACVFYANGDWGREGEVIHYPVCLAGVIETRTAELEGYGTFFDGE